MIYPDWVLTKSLSHAAFVPLRTSENYGIAMICRKMSVKENRSADGGKA